MYKFLSIVLIISFLAFVGCGQKTLTISGNVSFDGAPLNDGGIVLVPIDNPQTEFKEKIINGKYKILIPAEATGKMIVRIYAMRQEKKQLKTLSEDSLKLNPSAGMVSIMYIPKQYNTESTLTAEVSPTITVFDFKLEK
ncbi:MAG: hypothetical protein LBC20_08425 [Planctomycetaceae bacterium]|jgi:hypothetical protein|nr:hypothetical protein [Planctomycetaceae bacterium]